MYVLLSFHVAVNDPTSRPVTAVADCTRSAAMAQSPVVEAHEFVTGAAVAEVPKEGLLPMYTPDTGAVLVLRSVCFEPVTVGVAVPISPTKSTTGSPMIVLT